MLCTSSLSVSSWIIGTCLRMLQVTFCVGNLIDDLHLRNLHDFLQFGCSEHLRLHLRIFTAFVRLLDLYLLHNLRRWHLHQDFRNGHLLRYHVCRKTCLLDCLEYPSWHVHFALWALVWATHGLPVVRAPVYRGCPCQDPLVCPPMPRQDGIGSRAPTLCGCSVLVVVDL